MKFSTFKIFIVSVIAVILLSSGCEKGELGNAVLKYGTSFGFCAGYCNQSVEISESTTTFVKVDNQTKQTKTCTQPTNTALLEDILKTVDPVVINTLPERIGCPDCADGGAEWIEITRNGKTKRVTFEYGNAPESIKPGIEKLRTLKNSFVCQ